MNKFVGLLLTFMVIVVMTLADITWSWFPAIGLAAGVSFVIGGHVKKDNE